MILNKGQLYKRFWFLIFVFIAIPALTVMVIVNYNTSYNFGYSSIIREKYKGNYLEETLNSQISTYKSLASNVRSKILGAISYPFLKIQAYVVDPIRSKISYINLRLTDNANLVKLVNNYKNINQDLLSEIIELKAKLNQIEETQEILDYGKRYYNSNAILSQVLLYINSSQEHCFFIDGGKNRNINTKMVAVYKNCLLGRVSEVHEYWSKVTLITDKTCKISAQCANTKTQGILEGQGNIHSAITNFSTSPEINTQVAPKRNNLDSTNSSDKLNKQNNFGCMKLSFVDHLKPIEIGDLILSTGEGLIFPKGFGLGRVETQEIKDCDYIITVKPIINFSQISNCLLIQKGSEFNLE